MTNGEKIQEVFNCEVCEPIIEDDIIHVIFPDKNDSAIGFDLSWWNMEYKKPTTKNDLGVDAVSRKDVHDMLENLPITVEDKWFNWLQKACMRLAELPSVTPQEPMIVPIAEFKYDKDKLKELVNEAVLTIAPQEPRWIPVSEELPEDSGYYLASGKGKVWICEMLNLMGTKGWSNDASNPIVEAWMPLPKPYKMDGKDPEDE